MISGLIGKKYKHKGTGNVIEIADVVRESPEGKILWFDVINEITPNKIQDMWSIDKKLFDETYEAI